MKILVNLACLLLVAASGLLGYLFGNSIRRAWALRLLLDTPEALSDLVRPPFLDDPPALVRRWLKVDVAHRERIESFLYSDKVASARGNNIVRMGQVVSVVAAGVLGLVGGGPWGLLWPVAALAAFTITFHPASSGQPTVSEVAFDAARDYLRPLALMLDRWRSSDPAGPDAWLVEEGHDHLRPLYESVVEVRAGA